MTEAQREAGRERNRRWYKANRERALARVLAWQAENREAVRSADRRWRERNPEKVRERDRRRSRRRWLRRQVILERAAGLCGICGDPVDPTRFDVDHVVPLSLGGTFAPENLQPSHPTCNRRKGATLAA